MRPGDLFAAHFLDHEAPGAPARFVEQLREVGLVTLDGLATREAVLSFASRVMTISPHRDSDPDGLTTIRDSPRHAAAPGSPDSAMGSSTRIRSAPAFPVLRA